MVRTTNKTNGSWHWLLLSLFLILPRIVCAQMATAGQASVGALGNAEYSIPIMVPPGVAGLEPRLSLAYSSQGANGPLGIGWGIGGLSSITRCPATVAQDGVFGKLGFDSNDRYCLDGQRLILKSGTYGAAGSEYRTESDGFTKIVAYSAGGGAIWFKSWAKSGQISEYGNTSDSQIEAQGNPAAKVLALNKVSDAKGNAVEMQYVEDTANGIYLVSSVRYANNSAAVRFIYEQRPDPYTAYLAGSKTRATQRLQKVEVRIDGGNSLVRTYNLTYASAKTQLLSVQECTVTACMPAISATYANSPIYGFTAPGSGTWHAHAGGIPYNVTGDFNGDGRTDLVAYYQNRDWHVCLSTGSDFQCQFWQGHNKGLANNVTGDFNGDGKMDMAGYQQGWDWEVCLSTGAGFSCQIESIHGGGVPYNVSGDFNGDGRTDLAGYYNNWQWQICLSTGTGFNCRMGNGHDGGVPYNVSGDFNGDGRTDIAAHYTGTQWVVCLSNGIEFIPCQTWQGHNGGIPKNVAGDFNGDGLTDLAGYQQDWSWNVCLSTGSGFSCSVKNATSGGLSWNVAGDFNGDGKTDLAGYYRDREWVVCLSNGEGFDCSSWQGHGGGIPYNASGDFNGDGLTDLIGYYRDYEWDMALSGATTGDRLTSVSNGAGFVVGFSYKSLSDGSSSSVYAKDSGGLAAAYPRADVQAPIYVVSEMSTSDGRSGTFTKKYTYGGLKTDLTGRGLLGFRWMKMSEPSNLGTSLTNETEYSQDWPYTGMVRRTTGSAVLPSSSVVLKQADYSFGCKVPETGSATATTCPIAPGNRYFPYVSQVVEQSRDLNGVLLPTVTTTSKYSVYGNATEINVVSSDGYSKKTVNTYIDDTTNWYLGRLTRATVTSVTP